MMRRLLAFLFALCSLTVAMPLPAHAAGSTSGSQFQACSAERTDVTDTSDNPTTVSTDLMPLLAIQRWGDAAGSVHTRLGANAWDDTDSKINRQWTGSSLFRMGNALWSGTTELLEFAEHFDVLCAAAASADAAAAKIGWPLAGGDVATGFVPVLVFAGVAALIWRKARRSENIARSLTSMLLATGLFFAMLFGASRTSGEGAGAQFGTFSPGWIALSIDDAVSILTAEPIEALSLGDSASTDSFGLSPNGLSADTGCPAYRARLRELYAAGPGAGNAVTMSMSSLWEESGLLAWRNFQFGAKNTSAKRVDCLLLENLAGTTSTEEIPLIQLAFGMAVNRSHLDWESNKEVDRAIIMFATCPSNSAAVAPEWQAVGVPDVPASGLLSDIAGAVGTAAGVVTNPAGGTAGLAEVAINGVEGATIPVHPIGATNEECAEWSNSGATHKDLGSFEIGEYTDSESGVLDRTVDAPAARNFLLNFHGDSYGSGVTQALAYLFAAIIVAFVFASLALANIIAGVLIVVSIPLAMFACAASIWPSKNPNNSPILSFAKFWSGATVFKLCFAAVMGVTALMTSYIAALGTQLLEPGGVMGSVWTGLSPVFAVIAVHIMCKRILKVSPFKPTAALGMGVALAGGGAFVGAGLTQALRQARYRASTAKYQASRFRAYRRNGGAGMNPGARRGRHRGAAPGGAGYGAGGAAGAAGAGSPTSPVGGAGGPASPGGASRRPTTAPGGMKGVLHSVGRSAATRVTGTKGAPGRKRKITALGAAAAVGAAPILAGSAVGGLALAGVAYGATRIAGRTGARVAGSRPVVGARRWAAENITSAYKHVPYSVLPSSDGSAAPSMVGQSLVPEVPVAAGVEPTPVSAPRPTSRTVHTRRPVPVPVPSSDGGGGMKLILPGGAGWTGGPTPRDLPAPIPARPGTPPAGGPRLAPPSGVAAPAPSGAPITIPMARTTAPATRSTPAPSAAAGAGVPVLVPGPGRRPAPVQSQSQSSQDSGLIVPDWVPSTPIRQSAPVRQAEPAPQFQTSSPADRPVQHLPSGLDVPDWVSSTPARRSAPVRQAEPAPQFQTPSPADRPVQSAPPRQSAPVTQQQPAAPARQAERRQSAPAPQIQTSGLDVPDWVPSTPPRQSGPAQSSPVRQAPVTQPQAQALIVPDSVRRSGQPVQQPSGLILPESVRRSNAPAPKAPKPAPAPKAPKPAKRSRLLGRRDDGTGNS